MSTAANQSTQSGGLGHHSARGLLYLFASATGSKLVSFCGQIALSYLLSESDYGVVATAYAITGLIQVIEQAGVGDVLVQRRKFGVWSLPAFWLALSLGVLSCVLIAASAPIASSIVHDDQLFWMLLILAPASIPTALSVVPRAQLSRELRFRALATINWVDLSLRMVLTVAFAAAGFGPYSFALPVPIMNVGVALFLWWWVRPKWSSSPRLNKWRYLIGDSARILTAELQRVVLDQSDYVMLRLFRTKAEVGLYFFGFTFAIQILQFLAFNLMNVLFPALTKLNDQPQAQFQGFLKAQRILAAVGISACFLQAATAAPLTYLILDPKWIPSIGVMQILCIGMAFRMVAGSSYALLKAQGRFRAILWNRWGFVALQLSGLLLVLTLGGGINSVAMVVGAVSMLVGPITFYTAITPYGAGWLDVARVLFRPTACGTAAVGAGWLLALEMESQGIGPLAQLIVTISVAVALNSLLAWQWMRPVWDDFWNRVGRLLPHSALAWARK